MAQFDDGKDQSALRTIGEVADALGIRQHVLRYWEQQFPMLQPLKRSGGRRYYRAEDVALVEAIDRLVNREGYTLKGAIKALSHKNMTDQHNEQAGEPASAASAVNPLPLADELPQDGGLDAFFGRPAAAEREENPVFQKDGDAAPQSALADAELLDRLKSIRERLAQALAA